MSDRKKDLVQAYFDKKMSRRELFDRMAKLGVGAAATGVLMNSWTSKALAAGGTVDFQKHKGKTIRLLMNKHPYMDAMHQEHRELQEPDRDVRHLRHLPGGRVLRQGDDGAVASGRPNTTPS